MSNNSNRISLRLYNRPVSSDYQLLGNDENALTFALGHCLSRDDEFLAAFLRWCGFKGTTKTQAGHAEINLQSFQKFEGITDLEVLIPGRLQLIVEAKVGGGFPEENQVATYVKRLMNSTISSRILVLTQVGDGQMESRLRKSFVKRITFRTWAGVRELALRIAQHEDSTFNVQTLSDFMKEVYGMSLDAEEEVWIVPLSAELLGRQKNVSVADLHVKHSFWVMGARTPRRSLYMGFRYNGHLQYIGRIGRIDRGIKSRQIGPKLAMEYWREKHEPYDVVRLENLIRFPKKLPSGNLHNRHVYCDFDLLLSSDTIVEAANRTSERRKKKARRL